MTGNERKRAFREEAFKSGETLAFAAITRCGVTWEHLSRGIDDENPTPLSAEVKQKFADYIGRPVEDVFGEATSSAA